MAGNDTSQDNRSLWISFVSIAQPYFLLSIRKIDLTALGERK
jgi:hypothetical protein